MNELPVVSVHDFLMSHFELDILKARHVFSKDGKIPVKLPVRSSYTGKIFFRTYWKRPQDISPEHMKYVDPEYAKMLKNPKPDEPIPKREETEEEYDKRVKHSKDWEEYKRQLDEQNAKKKAEREKKKAEREAKRKEADQNYKPKTWERTGRKRLSDKEWEIRRKEEWTRNAELEWRAKQRELYPDDPSKWEIPPDMKFTPPDDPNMWKRKTPYKSKEQREEAKRILDDAYVKMGHAPKENWSHITIGGKSLDQVFRIPKELITPPPDITDKIKQDEYIMAQTQAYVYEEIVNPIMEEFGCTATEARRIVLDYMEAYGIIWHLGGERWKRHERDCVNWCHAVQKLKRYMWAYPNDGSPPEELPEPAKPEPEPAKPEIPDGVTVNGINFTGEVLSSIKAARWEKGGKTYVVNADSFLNEASLVIRRSMTQLGHNPSKVTACNFDPAASKAIPTFKCVVEDDEGGSHEVTVKASTRRVEWNELQEEPEIPEITPPEEPEDITPPEEPEEEITPPEEPEEPEEPAPEKKEEPAQPEKYQPKLKFQKTAFPKMQLQKIPSIPGFRCDMEELQRRIGEYLEDNLGIEDIKAVKLVEIVDYEPQEGGDIELNVTYVKKGSKEEEQAWICLDNSGLRQYDTQDSYFSENIAQYSPNGRKINHDKLMEVMFDEFRSSVYGAGLKVGQRFNLTDIEITDVHDDSDDPSRWFVMTKCRVEVFTGNRKVREFTWEEPISTKNSADNDDGVLDKEITKNAAPTKTPEQSKQISREEQRAQYMEATRDSRYFWAKRYSDGDPYGIPENSELKFSEEESKEFAELDQQLETLGNQIINKYGTRIKSNAASALHGKYAKLPKTPENQHKYTEELTEFNKMFSEYDKADQMRNGMMARRQQRARTIERHTSGWRPDLEFEPYDTTRDTEELFGTDRKAFESAIARLTKYLNEDDLRYNCQRCEFAMNLLRMGYDVKVSKSADVKVGRGMCSKAIVTDPDTGRERKAKDFLPNLDFMLNTVTRAGGSYERVPDSGFKGLIKACQSIKNTQGDARFAVIYQWNHSSGARGGHIVYAEKKGDAVIFADTQRNRGWSNKIHDNTAKSLATQLNLCEFEPYTLEPTRCKFAGGYVVRLDTATDLGFDYALYASPKNGDSTKNGN